MVKVCECCGHPLPDDTVKGALTPMQRRLYDVIKTAGQAGIDIHNIMDRLYASYPNGGPEHYNVIHVQRAKMRPKLAAHGLKLTSPRGHGALWRLEKL